MSLQDDVVYLALLLFSILFGHLSRLAVRDASLRRSASTLCGVAVLLAVSGAHAAYCAASFLMQLALLALVPWRSAHLVSFVTQFAYLLFFRVAPQVWPSTFSWYPPHLNAVQMILTLKMVGVAYEIHDTRVRRIQWEKRKEEEEEDDEERESARLTMHYKDVDPSAVDIFHYAFSHAGLLTGPYYTYRTFRDLYSPDSYSAVADCYGACVDRLSRLPFYLCMFLVVGHLFPIDAVEHDSFYDSTSLLFRLFYTVPVFFTFRMRLYTGFVLSESSCIMAGLGAYPARGKCRPGNGPTSLEELEAIEKDQLKEEKFDFETVHNIDEYGAEFVPTMREALKTWNMTVQYWLATIVYRRFPLRSVRTAVVMLTSAFWHGVHSGYYLSIGSCPLVLAVEDLYARVVRRKLSQRGQELYDWVGWSLRMGMFCYLGMAFQLLRVDATLRFWGSVGFIGHAVLPALYLAGIFLVRPLMERAHRGSGQTD